MSKIDDELKERANHNDWYCRNCDKIFVPTYYVSAGYGHSTGQCVYCGGNATEKIHVINKEE